MSKLFNVKVSVVDLIEADSADEAVSAFRKHLIAAGFELYDGDTPDAFESEDMA